MDTNQLLPCPFCGRAPETSSRASTCNETGMAHFVVCYCGGYAAKAHIHADTEEGAITLWNTRSAPAAVPGPLEGESDAVRVLAKWHNWICTGQVNFTEDNIKESAEILRSHGKTCFDSIIAETKEGEQCPDCIKAAMRYDRLEARMSNRGNFGIVPLPRKCDKHRTAAKAQGARK